MADFCIGGVKITNARNIEMKDNLDGTSQLWFDTLLTDKEGKTHDARFHVFKLRIPGLISMEANESGKLYEVTYKDDDF